ncbi:hypothetical protein PFBG_06080, partial [Plasmodium falciparum 7G8]
MDLLHNTRDIDTNKNVDMKKYKCINELKNIMKINYYISCYPHHLNYFNWNLNYLSLCNIIHRVKEEGDSFGLENYFWSNSNVKNKEQKNITGNMYSNVFFDNMERYKSKYILRHLYERDNIYNYKTNNGLNEEETILTSKENDVLLYNDNTNNNKGRTLHKNDNILEKQKILYKKMFMNFDYNIFNEFLNINEDYHEGKEYYKFLNNNNNNNYYNNKYNNNNNNNNKYNNKYFNNNILEDSENEEIYEKHESTKIKLIHLIYSKRYEKEYFTFIFYEYNMLIQCFYHYESLIDMLKSLI